MLVLLAFACCIYSFYLSVFLVFLCCDPVRGGVFSLCLLLCWLTLPVVRYCFGYAGLCDAYLYWFSRMYCSLTFLYVFIVPSIVYYVLLVPHSRPFNTLAASVVNL